MAQDVLDASWAISGVKRFFGEMPLMIENPLSRREFPLGLAMLTAGTAVLRSSAARALPGDSEAASGLTHDAEAIHQEVLFRATPSQVYDVLVSPGKFEKISAMGRAAREMRLPHKPTRISADQGGAFELFGGFIAGRQLELVPGRRLVQAWREMIWEPGKYSIASFELSDSADGAKLVFDHTGFPKGAGPHLATGWYGNYWEPIRRFLT
jgi:activator of HSP90 ATPase